MSGKGKARNNHLRDDTFDRSLTLIIGGVKSIRELIGEPKTLEMTVRQLGMFLGIHHQNMGMFMGDPRAMKALKTSLNLAKIVYGRVGKLTRFIFTFRNGKGEHTIVDSDLPEVKALVPVKSKGKGKGNPAAVVEPKPKRRKIDEFQITVACYEQGNQWHVEMSVEGDDSSVVTKMTLRAGDLQKLSRVAYPGIGDRVIAAFESQ